LRKERKVRKRQDIEDERKINLSADIEKQREKVRLMEEKMEENMMSMNNLGNKNKD
jgi:hypothetical protein